ncbi:MAG: NADPH:quinone oxidoreductase family protein [Dehalococcoidia bacterium]
MRAVRLVSLDGPDGLEVADIPEPAKGDRLIVEVHAAGVGFPDLLMTRGRYQFRPDPPFVPGIEMAGAVHWAPEGSPFAPGDGVAAWSPLGCWAEYAHASPLATFRIPDGMSYAEATSLVNYQSAYFGLVERGEAREGESVLIHGAAGGVGSAAVDLARALGLVSFAVARGKDKLAVAGALGAEHLLDADSDWLAEVRRLTDNRGVDLVFDPVGGDRFLDSVRALAVGGRLLVVGFAGGAIPEVKVNRLLLKNTAVVGVAWGEYTRVDPEMPQRVGRALAELWSAGRLHPVVGATYPLEQAADALRDIESRRATGKVVLALR